MPAPSTTTETPLVQVTNLHVTFGRQKVLRDISLSVPRGQTVAIVGESGCGKTVLMKAIIGLIKPTSGQILFDGKDLFTLRLRVPERGSV
jgi:phospholipid/cholesterol/gamma-HCH transport system ATP-binding protein